MLLRYVNALTVAKSPVSGFLVKQKTLSDDLQTENDPPTQKPCWIGVAVSYILGDSHLPMVPSNILDPYPVCRGYPQLVPYAHGETRKRF
jgi:hypothetical protein